MNNTVINFLLRNGKLNMEIECFSEMLVEIFLEKLWEIRGHGIP